MARTFPALETILFVVVMIVVVVVAGIEWKVQIRFCMISRRIAEANQNHQFSLGETNIGQDHTNRYCVYTPTLVNHTPLICHLFPNQNSARTQADHTIKLHCGREVRLHRRVSLRFVVQKNRSLMAMTTVAFLHAFPQDSSSSGSRPEKN